MYSNIKRLNSKLLFFLFLTSYNNQVFSMIPKEEENKIDQKNNQMIEVNKENDLSQIETEFIEKLNKKNEIFKIIGVPAVIIGISVYNIYNIFNNNLNYTLLNPINIIGLPIIIIYMIKEIIKINNEIKEIEKLKQKIIENVKLNKEEIEEENRKELIERKMLKLKKKESNIVISLFMITIEIIFFIIFVIIFGLHHYPNYFVYYGPDYFDYLYYTSIF